MDVWHRHLVREDSTISPTRERSRDSSSCRLLLLLSCKLPVTNVSPGCQNWRIQFYSRCRQGWGLGRGGRQRTDVGCVWAVTLCSHALSLSLSLSVKANVCLRYIFEAQGVTFLHRCAKKATLFAARVVSQSLSAPLSWYADATSLLVLGIKIRISKSSKWTGFSQRRSRKRLARAR